MKLGRPLAVLLALGFALRVWGLGFGLPDAYHQDEPIVVNHAMAVGADGWNTGVYLPPQFASYFLFLFYAVYFLAGLAFGFFHGKEDFALRFVSDPSAFYLLGRFFLGVLPGTAAVALVYRLGERFFSKRTAFWAALFLAVAPGAVAHSHYIYVDMALAFATTLFFYALLSWLERPSMARALAAGAAFGWSVSVKYTAVYFAPAFVAALFLAPGGRVSRGSAVRQFVLAGLLSVGVYALVSPYSFLDWKNFTAQVLDQSAARGAQGFGHHLGYSLFNATGFLVLSLASIGAARAARRSGARAAVLLLPAAVYYLVNVKFSQPFLRYMMPLVPLVCLFAGEGVEAAGSVARRGLVAAIAGTAAAAQLLAPSVYFDVLLHRPDTRTECRRWFDAHVPEKSKILLENTFFAPRLPQTREQIEEKYSRLDAGSGARKQRLDLLLRLAGGSKAYTVYYLLRDGEDPAKAFLLRHPLLEPKAPAIADSGIEYVVLNYSDPSEELRAWREGMGSRARLVASFSPFFDPSRRRPDDPQGLTGPPDSQADLFSRRSPGPYLEVYKIVK